MSIAQHINSLKIAFFIGYRYSKTTTKSSFVSFINMVSVMGITLGIAALIVVLSVMNGLEGQLKERILGILPHIVVETQHIEDLALLPLEDVVSISPFVEQELVVQSRTSLKGVFLQGLDPSASSSLSIISQNMLAGRFSDLRSGDFNTIISRSLAQQLGVSVGQRLRLISTVASIYSPFGRLPSQRLATVSGIFEVGSEMDDKVIIMHIDDVARLSRVKSESFNSYRIYLQDAFEYQAVTAVLKTQNITHKTWRERQGKLFDAVKMEKNMMALMLLLIIAVAAFNVISALVMVVNEKTADIAILQTQGLGSRDIMLIFVLNGLINGLKGVLFGLLLGLLLVSQLNNLLSLLGSNLAFGPNGSGLPIDLRWSQVVLISTGSLVLCILATLYPAKKAARIEPARSLQGY